MAAGTTILPRRFKRTTTRLPLSFTQITAAAGGPAGNFSGKPIALAAALIVPTEIWFRGPPQPRIVLRRPIKHSLESLEFVRGEGEITPVKQHGFGLPARSQARDRIGCGLMPGCPSINSLFFGLARRLIVPPRGMASRVCVGGSCRPCVRTLCLRRYKGPDCLAASPSLHFALTGEPSHIAKACFRIC
jgi:hypothetical protein